MPKVLQALRQKDLPSLEYDFCQTTLCCKYALLAARGKGTRFGSRALPRTGGGTTSLPPGQPTRCRQANPINGYCAVQPIPVAFPFFILTLFGAFLGIKLQENSYSGARERTTRSAISLSFQFGTVRDRRYRQQSMSGFQPTQSVSEMAISIRP